MNSNAVSQPSLCRATEFSAGYDLQSTNPDTILEPGQRALFGIGVVYELPKNLVAIIKPRSGLAVKYGIDVLAGVCDADYRGEVKVCLINHGSEPAPINRGDRIAQLLILDYHTFENEQTPVTVRGSGGFGSTGVANYNN